MVSIYWHFKIKKWTCVKFHRKQFTESFFDSILFFHPLKHLFITLQGVYTFNMETPSIQVDTFCVHGGPDGYITGIRGRVQCLPEEELGQKETGLERQEMIKEKCYLRFPTLPFIPKEPYDVIATDYDTYALVSGAKDRSFIQVIKHVSLTIVINGNDWVSSFCRRVP